MPIITINILCISITTWPISMLESIKTGRVYSKPIKPRYLNNSRVDSPMPKVAITSDNTIPLILNKTKRYIRAPAMAVNKIEKIAAKT